MGRPSTDSMLSYVRGLAAPPERATDRELLGRFTVCEDETAFAAIVARHGPLVLSVCRSVLRDEHMADDAFQATFLVLARKADSIVKCASLGSWLHGVALRVARKAKTATARREQRERRASVPEGVVCADDLTWRELREVLHEEVARLPEKHRVPLLLCYWEAKTQEEAARLVGCPRATLKERLARARDALRGRLRRRGLGLSVPLFATLLAPCEVPAALARSAALAAGAFARGGPTDGPARAALRRGKPHPKGAQALALAADGRSLVTADRDGVPCLWDARTGEALHRLRGHAGTVDAVAIAPDGRLAATGGRDRTVRLWEARTGREVRPPIRLRNDVGALAFSADGKTLASGSGAAIRLWGVTTGREVHPAEGHHGELYAATPSPDGRLLATTGRDCTVCLWDLA